MTETLTYSPRQQMVDHVAIPNEDVNNPINVVKNKFHYV